LAAQLSQPTWAPNPSGKILIESKVQMRSRGIKSPDQADALALTMIEGGEMGRPIPRISPVSFTRENPYIHAG
jgi:hypothetical protein